MHRPRKEGKPDSLPEVRESGKSVNFTDSYLEKRNTCCSWYWAVVTSNVNKDIVRYLDKDLTVIRTTTSSQKSQGEWTEKHEKAWWNQSVLWKPSRDFASYHRSTRSASCVVTYVDQGLQEKGNLCEQTHTHPEAYSLGQINWKILNCNINYETWFLNDLQRLRK